MYREKKKEIFLRLIGLKKDFAFESLKKNTLFAYSSFCKKFLFVIILCFFFYYK